MSSEVDCASVHNFPSSDHLFLVIFSRVVWWLLACRQYEHSLIAWTGRVCKGHNFLVTGQGGTKKSTVVREIISGLQAAGKKVSVVCFSGTAV